MPGRGTRGAVWTLQSPRTALLTILVVLFCCTVAFVGLSPAPKTARGPGAAAVACAQDGPPAPKTARLVALSPNTIVDTIHTMATVAFVVIHTVFVVSIVEVAWSYRPQNLYDKTQAVGFASGSVKNQTKMRLQDLSARAMKDMGIKTR